MRFFTRSPDLEAQSSPHTRTRGRSKSKSITRPGSPQKPRSRSHTRSMSAQPIPTINTSQSRSAPISKASTDKTIETPISPTPVFGKPAIPYDNPLLTSFKTAPSSPLPSTRQPTLEEPEKVPPLSLDEKVDSEKSALLEKYDLGDVKIDVANISDMNIHRKMVSALFLDNLVCETARLQRHVWVAGSEKGVYRDLCTADRRDKLHEDLQRYIQAMQAWTYFKTCTAQHTDLLVPPNFDTYGRTLAMLECASRHETDPASLATIKEMSTALFKDLADWTQSISVTHSIREQALKECGSKHRLLNRMAMSTFGGLTLIVPMLIMVLDTRKWTTVVTTSVFTLVIGLTLAIWMTDADAKDMIAATAAYAAVLVVFVGASS